MAEQLNRLIEWMVEVLSEAGAEGEFAPGFSDAFRSELGRNREEDRWDLGAVGSLCAV
jgi:hypothetical protein